MKNKVIDEFLSFFFNHQNRFLSYDILVINMIKANSKEIKKGDVFIAIKGEEKDGHDYIDEAIANGAELIIAERGKYSVSSLLVPDTKSYLREYLTVNEYPKIKDIKLIGITGTNGKTTSSYLFYEALKILNKKVAYIGTIGFYKDEKIKDLNNTTPGLLELYELLEECTDCEYVVMEVSSHALSMGRVDTLLFDYVIFTNLTREHLNYHKTMENYAKAKQELFKKIKKNGKAIVNIDDQYADYFILPENNNITYGMQDSDYRLLNYDTNSFTIFHEKEYQFKTKLFGKYNVYNLLTTIILLNEENLLDPSVISKLEAPRGRIQKVDEDKMIFVDYAHTPDGVFNVLNAMQEIKQGKIYTILGCGGNRDREKRKDMGKIAAMYSDYVIFTSDNPRFEDPLEILNDMTCQLNVKNFEIIENREKAIQKGVQITQKNDILLVLGKGHEDYQIIKDKKIHFDDVEIIKKYILE